MKQSETFTNSIEPTKHSVTAADSLKIIQRFQDLDKVLLTERYVFRQDLKNYEGQISSGFRIKGHFAVFEIQNILSDFDIRHTTFVKRSHGPDEESEIHIDPQFNQFFLYICKKLNHLCNFKDVKRTQLQTYNFLYQRIH